MCKWSVDTATGAPLLLLAGKNGLLRVVNCMTGMLEMVRGAALLALPLPIPCAAL